MHARRHLAAGEKPRHGTPVRVQGAALRVDDDAAERTVRRGRDGNEPFRRIHLAVAEPLRRHVREVVGHRAAGGENRAGQLVLVAARVRQDVRSLRVHQPSPLVKQRRDDGDAAQRALRPHRRLVLDVRLVDVAHRRAERGGEREAVALQVRGIRREGVLPAPAARREDDRQARVRRPRGTEVVHRHGSPLDGDAPLQPRLDLREGDGADGVADRHAARHGRAERLDRLEAPRLVPVKGKRRPERERTAAHRLDERAVVRAVPA